MITVKKIPDELIETILNRYSEGITYTDLIIQLKHVLPFSIPSLELLYMLKEKVASGKIPSEKIILTSLPRAFTDEEKENLRLILVELSEQKKKITFHELAALFLKRHPIDFTVDGLVQKLMFMIMPLDGVVEDDDEDFED